MRDRKRDHARRGFVYFVQRPSNGAIKIGFTSNPGQRIAYHASMLREPLRTLGIVSNTTMRLERELHEWFAPARIPRAHPVIRRGGRNPEWFRATDDLLSFISVFATAPIGFTTADALTRSA